MPLEQCGKLNIMNRVSRSFPSILSLYALGLIVGNFINQSFALNHLHLMALCSARIAIFIPIGTIIKAYIGSKTAKHCDGLPSFVFAIYCASIYQLTVN